MNDSFHHLHSQSFHSLPPRQQEAFDAIASIIRRGRTPQTAELLRLLKMQQVSSLTYLLHALREKGLVAIEGGVRGQQRVITLTDKGRSVAQMGVPVLGKIAAGPMIAAMNEASERIDPGNALKVLPGDFFLPVAGDSMIGDGILDGDRVLIRPNVLLGNGEIAAVADTQDDTTGEYLATLKRVYHSPQQKSVRLKASNPKYDDLVLPANRVHIVGAFRGLLRPFQD